MANSRRATSARTVWALIAVETLCLLGAEISRFGMTIWILARSGEHSVSAFSYLMAANIVPGMLALYERKYASDMSSFEEGTLSLKEPIHATA